MRQAGVVAVAALLEHSRRKLLAFFLVASVLITAVLLYFATDRAGNILFGSQQNIALVASFGFLQFFALLAALATSMGNVGRPYSSGEAILYLARPMQGWQFAVGRYLGGVGSTAAICLVLAVEMQAVNLVAGAGMRLDVWGHWGVVFFNLSVISAIATLLSVFISTPIVVAILGYFANQVIQGIALLHRLLPVELSGLARWLRSGIEAAWYLSPKLLVSPLEADQVRTLGGPPAAVLESPGLSSVWALAWLFALVAGAGAATNRKEL